MTTARVLSTPRPIRRVRVRTYEEQDPMTVEQDLGNRQAIADTDHMANVVHALNTQEAFTREQVAWLMSEAMRWGYEARGEEDRGFWAGYRARVDEENAAYPPPSVLAFGKWFDQAAERVKADAAARLPRAGDFKGCDVRPGKTRVAA